MNWDAIGAAGEILGAVGVLATLAYLAVQVKHQVKATKVQNIRLRTAERQKVYEMQLDPLLQEAWRKYYVTGEDASFTDNSVMESFNSACLASSESDYQLFVEGLTDKDEWSAAREILKLLFDPEPSRRWWKEIARTAYMEPFRSEVDKIVEEKDSAPSPYSENWIKK